MKLADDTITVGIYIDFISIIILLDNIVGLFSVLFSREHIYLYVYIYVYLFIYLYIIYIYIYSPLSPSETFLVITGPVEGFKRDGGNNRYR